VRPSESANPPPETFDHAFNRGLAGDLAKRLQVRIASYAEVYSVMPFDRRGMSVPAFEAQLT